jgi:tetratricopeptide (TPR) repeat protein
VYRLHVEFQRLRGRLAWQTGDREAAVKHFEQALTEAGLWRIKEPRRVLAHRSLVGVYADLGMTLNYLERFSESTAAHRGAIRAAEEMLAEFPDDPTARATLCNRLSQFAYRLRDRFRRQDLAEAADCAARATAANDGIAETVTLRRPRWQLLGTQAAIADARGTDDAAGLWAVVDAELSRGVDLAGQLEQDRLIEALTGVARWRLLDGDADAARARLQQAGERIAAVAPLCNKRMAEVGWLEAQLAVARGDHAAAAAAAERIVAARSTWFGKRRAADCLRLAWRAAGAAAVAAGYRDRAAGYYRDVVEALATDAAKHAHDPYYVVPWGFAMLHLAAIANADGDGAAARARLEAALPALDAVRDDALADEWDGAAYEGAKALRAELAGDGR